LKETLQEIDNSAQEIGFVINQENPKYVRVSTKTHNQYRQMAVGGYEFERVSSFPYIGSIISDDNSIAEEITH
jgi:hypothetical protein